ncbi:MAG: hypothetical protein CUN52_03955 [Phototrophicales bacterium]|nr:MAG: hypothetical protein CUN52_03955 [Phototrophicales bacterium]
MLKIAESSPTRLILRDQRRWASLLAVIFTLISMGALIIFMAQIVTIIESRYERDGMLWVMVTIIFFLLIISLVMIGIIATRHLTYGIHCEFDRQAETMTIRRIGVFRPIEIRHSIYAISHVEAHHNSEIGVYGIFLILKDNSQIPLASFYVIDETEMQTVINEIRTFLRR